MSAPSLSIRLGGRNFGLPLVQAREILPLPPLTHVPAAPPYVLGVFNLVGRIVPVLDLAVKLGLGTTAFHDAACVVVADVRLDGENAVVGILTEEIGDVVDAGAFDQLELDAVMEVR